MQKPLNDRGLLHFVSKPISALDGLKRFFPVCG